MVSTNSRPTVLAVLAALAVVTSGFAGVALAESPSTPDAQPTASPDGDEVIDSFVERLSTLETVEFTRTTESTFGNETTIQSVRVAADLEDGQKRTETLNATVGSNTTTVMNETTRVTYNADENTVTDYELRGERTLLPTIDALTNESLVSYEFAGTDTVEGQDVYVLEATPKQQQQTDTETALTIYVNRETSFPVQVVSETTTENYDYRSTVTYSDVTINEELPESTFELDVPDDATDPTENLGPDISTYVSYEALTSNASVAVPDTELAAGFSFDGATVIDGENYYTVSLRYTDGEESISVRTRAAPTEYDRSGSDRYDAVDIGGTTGYLHAGDEFVILHWETDQPYMLYGAVTEETAIDIAESIGSD